jgi:hypothetical protein
VGERAARGRQEEVVNAAYQEAAVRSLLVLPHENKYALMPLAQPAGDEKQTFRPVDLPPAAYPGSDAWRRLGGLSLLPITGPEERSVQVILLPLRRTLKEQIRTASD